MTARLHGRLAALFLAAFLLTDRGALASDIIDTLAGTRSFSTLLDAIKAAGLEDSLRGAGPYTLFAPTNEAFTALPPGLMDVLMKPENRPQLAATIKRHLLPGRLLAREQAGRHRLIATVAGTWLAIDGTAGVLMIDDDVEVLQADIAADNGVIHIIDSVMLRNGPSEAAIKGAF